MKITRSQAVAALSAFGIVTAVGLYQGALGEGGRQYGLFDDIPARIRALLTWVWEAATSPAAATATLAAGSAALTCWLLLRRGVGDTTSTIDQPEKEQREVAWRQMVAAQLPARTAAVEATASRLDTVLRNQSLAIRYRRAETQVENAAAKIEDMLPLCQAAFASREEPKTSLQAMERTRRRHALGLVLQELEASLAATLGAPVKLTAHPNYTLNPMRAVSGDGEIEDPEQRQEYRRVHDQATTALVELQRLHGIISSARDAAERVTVDLTDTPLI